jgi:hypothetical protein
MVISTAVIPGRVTTPIIVSISTIKARAAVVIAWAVIVGIGRITRVVIRSGVDVVGAGVIVATG